MSGLYAEYAKHYRSMNRLDAADFAKAARRYSRLYDRFLPTDRTARILDLGCGGGHFLFYVRSR